MLHVRLVLIGKQNYLKSNWKTEANLHVLQDVLIAHSRTNNYYECSAQGIGTFIQNIAAPELDQNAGVKVVSRFVDDTVYVVCLFPLRLRVALRCDRNRNTIGVSTGWAKK